MNERCDSNLAWRTDKLEEVETIPEGSKSSRLLPGVEFDDMSVGIGVTDGFDEHGKPKMFESEF